MAGSLMFPPVIGTVRETVLQALQARLEAHLASSMLLEPLPLFLREQDGPDVLPPGGLVILRDGSPGEPEVMLSPLTYLYEHRAEIDVMVAGAERIRRFDLICAAIGTALPVGDTLGGLCDWTEAQAPEPVAVVTEGGETVKAATIGVTLTYSTPSPLT
jgi:hypothetical protein